MIATPGSLRFLSLAFSFFVFSAGSAKATERIQQSNRVRGVMAVTTGLLLSSPTPIAHAGISPVSVDFSSRPLGKAGSARKPDKGMPKHEKRFGGEQSCFINHVLQLPPTKEKSFDRHLDRVVGAALATPKVEAEDETESVEAGCRWTFRMRDIERLTRRDKREFLKNLEARISDERYQRMLRKMEGRQTYPRKEGRRIQDHRRHADFPDQPEVTARVVSKRKPAPVMPRAIAPTLAPKEESKAKISTALPPFGWANSSALIERLKRG